MTNNCLKNFHPASMYYCPKNNNIEGTARNPEAINMAYGNKRGGNFCNKKVNNMGQNNACYPFDKKSMSELAWNNRYNDGVSTFKWQKISGGGYYKAVNEPPIGGRAAISSYPNCCPPVFCGELTGGKKNRKKISISHRIGHSINETDKLLQHLKKNDLNKLLNKFLKNNKKYNIVNYNNYFNKKILRTLASTLLLDLYINKKDDIMNIKNMKEINNILVSNKRNGNIMSYIHQLKIDNKKLKNLHKGGNYPPSYYPLGYYIAPIGANAFTASAIVFLMSLLYKINKDKIGGGKYKKKTIIDKINSIISRIHLFDYSKKSIENLGKISLNVRKSIKRNRRSAINNYRGGSLLDRSDPRDPSAYQAFSEINPAPIQWNVDNKLSYNRSPVKKLQNEPISQENVSKFVKNGLVGAVGGRKKKYKRKKN